MEGNNEEQRKQLRFLTSWLTSSHQLPARHGLTSSSCVLKQLPAHTQRDQLMTSLLLKLVKRALLDFTAGKISVSTKQLQIIYKASTEFLKALIFTQVYQSNSLSDKNLTKARNLKVSFLSTFHQLVIGNVSIGQKSCRNKKYCVTKVKKDRKWSNGLMSSGSQNSLP